MIPSLVRCPRALRPAEGSSCLSLCFGFQIMYHGIHFGRIPFLPMLRVSLAHAINCRRCGPNRIPVAVSPLGAHDGTPSMHSLPSCRRCNRPRSVRPSPGGFGKQLGAGLQDRVRGQCLEGLWRRYLGQVTRILFLSRHCLRTPLSLLRAARSAGAQSYCFYGAVRILGAELIRCRAAALRRLQQLGKLQRVLRRVSPFLLI